MAVPSPNVQAIIPALLACLPVAFASHKPPPDLLPLLSPILRQRLDLHSSTSSGHDSWLRLLCWDPTKAEELKELVENSNFEPHPVSGELEVGEIERISYKRFDPETLQAQLPLADWSVTVLLLWCMGEEHAWKVSEILPYDSDLSQDSSWSDSPSSADELAKARRSSLAVPANNAQQVSQAQDDDDDYWAQYDQTPNAGTPGPRATTVTNGTGSSDADYYARYAEVQPAMDNYDPDEQMEEARNGSAPDNTTLARIPTTVTSQRLDVPDEDVVHIDHPIPSSPSSRGSDTIARLESTADRYSASEIAIKQHISYTMKSLYRLSKGSGLPRQEFEDIVQRELETLSLLDRE